MLAPMIGTQTKRAIRPAKVFRPLPWQVTPWRDKSPVLLLTGSAGGGKSKLALEKVNGFCLKYPGAFALLLRKVKASMTSGTTLFFEDEVVLSEIESTMSGARHYPSKSRFEYANGSIAAYVGLEDKKQLDRLKSIGRQGGVDIAVMEEGTEFTEADFNAVSARMRGRAAPWRQIIIPTNPDAPTHWIYRRLIQNGEASIYYSGAADNPYNPDDYLRTLSRLTGVDKLRLAEGQWVQATGLIYDVWSEEHNVTEEAEYRPDGGPLYWAVDDGYVGEFDVATGTYTAGSHPRVFLLCQMRADGRLVVFAEDYAVRVQPEDHITAIQQLPYPAPEFAAVDKSAAALIGRLNAAGIYTQRGPASVEESIKETRQWLAPDENGWRRLLVHPRCKHLRQEMVSYVYGDNQRPVKEHDHGPDALRYLIWRLRFEVQDG